MEQQSQNLSQFDFKSNPYLEMLQGSGAMQQEQSQAPDMSAMMAQAGGGQQQPTSPQTQAGGGQQDVPPNQLKPGQNPGRTKLLIGAVGAIEKFITESDSREDIMLARGIASALSRLIARDQEKFASEL